MKKETKYELIYIEIPEGKELVKTELENGLLLTFDDEIKLETELFDQYSLDELFYSSLLELNDMFTKLNKCSCNHSTYKQESKECEHSPEVEKGYSLEETLERINNRLNIIEKRLKILWG